MIKFVPHFRNKMTECQKLTGLVGLRQLNAIKEILNRSSCDLNEPNKNGDTLAMIAAKQNDFEMLRFLLEKGANINIRDGNGREIRDYGIFFNNKEITDLLYKSPSKH